LCEAAVLYTDGASKGNPGPAGAGFVLYSEDGVAIARAGIPLGEATNNVAEYRGLIAGLHEASARGIGRVRVRTDSQLLVRQLTGRYRVRSERIRRYYEWAQRLVARFEDFQIEHIAREDNAEADRLASDAAKCAGGGRDERRG